MDPAYADGTWVHISPFSYTLTNPKRGDVVALRSLENPRRWELKRIIGLPHEAITWNGGSVWINGLYLPELYVSQALAILGDDSHHLLLGPEEYFVLGDNRLHSRDSRAYGPVLLRDILGQIS